MLKTKDKLYPSFSSSQIKNLNGIYTELFKYKNNGIFIDIGAHDGETGSNTSVLADIGWTGYYIEPEITSFWKCQDRHKENKVKCYNFAIGNYEGEIEIYNAGSLSTCSESLHKKFLTVRWSFNAHRKAIKSIVKIKTLDTFLLEEKIKPEFDVLNIDVEGFEYEVLKGFTISKRRPKVVVIELHENHPQLGEFLKEKTEKCHIYFKSNGYFKFWNDNINTIYVRI